MERRDDPLGELPASIDPRHLAGLVVIVGYGRVGRRIGETLAAQGVPFVVAERNREIVEKLRKKGVHAVFGDATDPEVLVQAHAAQASVLVIATPDTLGVRQMIETARALNPAVEILVRTHSEEEARLLTRENAGKVFHGESELAQGMARYALECLAARSTVADGTSAERK